MLKDMPFSALHLGEESFFASDTGSVDLYPVPDEYLDSAKKLHQMCLEAQEKHSKPEFQLIIEEKTFRVSEINSISGKTFILRVFPDLPSCLESLGLNEATVLPVLMRKGLTGLVLISGIFGSGKTTTAYSLVKSRLIKFGGVAVTIEDPMEMLLEGVHGKGRCYQTLVGEGGFAGSLKQAARWAPTIIFLAEVRDAETAMEALKASTNGVLVVVTGHGASVSEAVERLYTLAVGSGNYSAEDVSRLISTGLRAVVEQKLISGARDCRVEAQLIDCDTPAIRTNLANKRWSTLSETMAIQINKALMDTWKENK